MTDNNVLQFPGRIKNNKNVNPDQFRTWLESCNFPTIIHTIVNQLPHSNYLEGVPYEWWDVTGWGTGHNDETGLDGFILSSSLRRQTIPEFGTQSYTNFAWITYGWTDEEPEAQPFPDNPIDDLRNYFHSYPSSNSYNPLFCVALLMTIFEQPDIAFVRIERSEDQFFAVFYETQPVEGRWMKFAFGCDYLPMVLDDAAIALQYALKN
jgi:hypothetical protein